MDDDMFGYGQEDDQEEVADEDDSDDSDDNKQLVVEGKAISAKKQEAKQLTDSLK